MDPIPTLHKQPSFTASLATRIKKAFATIDTTGTGKISQEQFINYIFSNLGIPHGSIPTGTFDAAFKKFDLDNDGLMDETEFKYALTHVTELQLGNMTFAAQSQVDEVIMKKLETLKSKDFAETTTHKVDVKVGDTTGPFKTKFEIKYLIHGEAEAKHYQHISKNLHFSEESLGIIIRIHSSNPAEGAEKLQGFLDEVLGMAQAMLPPDSAPAKILNDLDFEVSNSDDVISFGVRVKDDCTNFFVLAILGSLEAYYHRLNQKFHFGVELKHDLHTLFTPGKPLSQLITDGLYIFAHLETNCADLIKTAFYKLIEVTHSKALKPLIATILQKNFHFDVTLPEVDAKDFLPAEVGGMDTSMALPMIQGVAGQITPFIENPPIPTLTTLTDLAKTNLKCNFSFTYKLAEVMVTFHFKTSGVKELLGL